MTFSTGSRPPGTAGSGTSNEKSLEFSGLTPPTGIKASGAASGKQGAPRIALSDVLCVTTHASPLPPPSGLTNTSACVTGTARPVESSLAALPDLITATACGGCSSLR